MSAAITILSGAPPIVRYVRETGSGGLVAQPRSVLTAIDRRNRCEFLVREILGDDAGLYVQRSRLGEAPPDGDQPVVVTLIARDEAARRRAERLLAGCAGFAPEEWKDRWVPLNLGDALIRIYPESSPALS
jgi:hypothetical protein